MAAMTKFYSFADELGAGTHVAAVDGTDTDVLRYALTNTTPVLTWDVLADIGAIDADTNSSETWNFDAGNTATIAATTGTVTVSGVDATVTATATVPTFRYVVLYNDTPTSPADPLIGYWDNGSAVDLTVNQVFTLNLDTDVLFTVA